MKKTIILFITVFLGIAVCFSSCENSLPSEEKNSSSGESLSQEIKEKEQDNGTDTQKVNTEQNKTTSAESHNQTEKNNSPVQNSSLPEYKPGSVKLIPQNDDDYPFVRKYRITYYRIWGEFSELLSEEEYNDYMEWTQKEAEESGYGEFQNEMLLVSFIKRYNITRDEFDFAVEKYIENCKKDQCDMSLEEYEVPNGDIIYTLDNEIINNYYRYE